MSEQYFRIRKWGTFQHYKSGRNPPWIKLHNEMLHSRTWVSVDDASKALAVAIMLLASRTGNCIPLDKGYIQRVCYLQSEPNLEALFSCDFIQLCDSEGSVLADASGTLASSPSLSISKLKEDKSSKKRAKKRATQLSHETLPDDWREYCQTKRPDLDPDAVFENFSDYHLARGNTFQVWKRAWQRWVREEKSRGYVETPGNGIPLPPKDNNQLEAYAKRHGAPAPRASADYTYDRYRQDLLTWRKEQGA